VQSPRHIVAFLRGVHGGEPTVLWEDFCGTAAVSRRWAAEGQKRGDDSRAVGVDLDADVLCYAANEAKAQDIDDRVTLFQADALQASEADRQGADVIFVGNFSIGYIKERRTLVEYLKRSRERLARGNAGFGGGVFVCDTYGGASAFCVGGLERKHPGRGKEIVRYSWQHEKADPLTAMVENSISFRVEVDGEVIEEHPRAFVYLWRLWGIAELRGAMMEAGFAATEVHLNPNVAPGERPIPILEPSGLGKDWIVLIVARTDR
jgi:hypothetical protein